ncbi:hypothetical protein RCL_jg28252.t1 [Rhizophagus clarus]|uniref:Uncharacterized protein n=1 Tax=Rhizophagus clarus TaxID=94130 RepID=A0A8H3LXE3_9GLOM|nr:hypothetical protein RCL_jg28252.t1 [Rhizophagus clarus]
MRRYNRCHFGWCIGVHVLAFFYSFIIVTRPSSDAISDYFINFRRVKAEWSVNVYFRGLNSRIVSGHVKGFIKNHFINVSFYFIGFGTGLWIQSGLDNEMVLEVIWVMKRFRKCFKMV